MHLTWFGWILVAVCVFICVFGAFYIANNVIAIIKKREAIKKKRGAKRV